MKSLYEEQPIDFMQRDDFQGSLDFFYGRYLDFFPTGKVGG